MTNTANFYFPPITADDGAKLYDLSRNPELTQQVSVLGKGRKENNDLAKAFATDKKDYPLACLINRRQTRENLGAVIVRNVGNDALDITIITADIGAYIETLLQLRNTFNCDAVFVTPNNTGISNALKFFSEVTVTPEMGQEFKIVF